jgi:hypothetical protein
VSTATLQNLFKTPEEGPSDFTNVTSLGATWGWSAGYANVNYYQYSLDSRRSGDASYDASGAGYFANVGFYGAKWLVDTGLSYYRSDELASLLRAGYGGYDGYVSVTLRPDLLPDFSTTVGIGEWTYDGYVYSTFARGTYLNVTAALDFAKFLWPGSPVRVENKTVIGRLRTKSAFAMHGPYTPVPSLKAFYRYIGAASDDVAGAKDLNDHYFGVAFRTLF